MGCDTTTDELLQLQIHMSCVTFLSTQLYLLLAQPAKLSQSLSACLAQYVIESILREHFNR